MARPIQVEIDVKSQAAIGAFAGIASSVTSAGISLVKAGIEAGIEAIGHSIELASDKAEAASKVNVLFADSAGQIERASQTAATTVGLSSGAYLEAAGNLGNLLTNFDLTDQAAADMSQGMIQLAADVGSFNNADPSEVVEAMGAAMRGESEPMRRFGVLIDEAGIKAYGMAHGLDTSKTALDQSGRATAIYQLMLEQTSDAQGDFIRTSDGLANQQRINAARMDDAMTRIGEALMPLVQKIMPVLADVLVGVAEGIGDLVDAAAKWLDDNKAFVDSVVELGRVLWDLYTKYIGALIATLGELGYRVGGIIGLFVDLAKATVDMGSAIVKVLSGDFEGAAADAQRSLGELQSFQENVQRAMGDDVRRQADMAKQVSDQAAADQAEIWESAASESINALAGVPPAYAGVGQQAGTALTNNLGASLTAGKGAVGGASDALGREVVEGVQQGRIDAAREAYQTPGEIADKLRSGRSAVKSAMDQLGTDMENSMSAAKERAELQAMLTGKRIAAGLASQDPVVRAQAQETVNVIQTRLEALADSGWKWGHLLGSGISAGLQATVDRVETSTDKITGAVYRRIILKSPAKEGPWSLDGGPIEWMRRNGERMTQALSEGLTSLTPRVPSIALAGAGAGAGGLAPLTVNVYAGVGDPVEIGRQVSETLRAYQRASGTE